MKDCSVETVRLSSVQVNLSDVQQPKQDLTKVEETGKRPGSGPTSAFILNFRIGRHLF